jgi:site-specific recombinase XerD
MDIVKSFKNHLVAQKNPPTAITIKNYVADIRRFLTWYSQTFHRIFTAEELTHDIVLKYQNHIQTNTETSLPSARSAKRYISSLRKFAGFLEDSGAIKLNPFTLTEPKKEIIDPFFLKEFRNFLFTEHASKFTIKNYLIDIKQFIAWMEQVLSHEIQEDTGNLLHVIDNNVLDQYKNRLLIEAKLSPISINRKLSSLRRYIKWLEEKGIIDNLLIEQEQDTPKATIKKDVIETSVPELPLMALKGIDHDTEAQKYKKYSSFPPLRLIQKTTKLITLTTDLLFFNPIANFAEAMHYSLWKNGEKKIFEPVATILEASSYVPKGVSVKTIIPKATSIMAPQTANLASAFGKVRSYAAISNPTTVHNFAKTLYAPLQISTKHMTRWQKIIYHMRYRRPTWYTKYQSLAFVHYLHLGILILATVITGALLYNTWESNPAGIHEAVLSTQDTAPPRTLSFQGRLLDNNNTPITAETPLRFALYNSPTASGAALLWEENQNIKPDQNGYFSTTLGKIARINQSVFTDNPSLYIGLTVSDKAELAPRQQIPTTEYATSSQNVEGLKPITDSPDLAQNVLLALDSTGNLTIGGSSTHTFQATGGQFNLSGQALLLTTSSGSNGNIKIAPDGSGIIDLEKPIQNVSNSIGPGGIPGAVEVDDILSIFTKQSSRSALLINQNGTGDIISGKSNGIDKFSLDTNGNEFIGGNLILNGDTIRTNSTVFDIAGSTVKNLSIGNNATVLTLGGSTGITSINNNLSVQGTTSLNGAVNTTGLITTNGGITVPDSQKLILANFANGAIPFLNEDSQVVEDAGSFSWNDSSKTFNVTGALCIQDGTAVCGSTPGTIYATTTAVQSADLAENYVSSQILEPGDVVVMEGQDNTMAVIKSTSPYQKGLIGIISTNPGITLNSGAKTDSTHPNIYPLALQGRVPVNVSSINGQIKAGDDITSSSIPGVAMEASSSGQIVGKALESYSNSDPNAVGKIMVFVNLTYQTSPSTITDDGNLAVATESANLVASTSASDNDSTSLLKSLSDIAGTISLGAIQAQTITSQSLHIATDNITIGGQTLKEYVAGIVEEILNKEFDKRLAEAIPPTQIVSPVASDSARPIDQSISNGVSPTPITSTNAQELTASTSGTTIYNIYNSIASVSAQASSSATPSPTDTPPIASPSGSEIKPANSETNNSQTDTFDSENIGNNHFEPAASLSAQLNNTPNFQSNFDTFSQGLISLGPTSLTDVGVSGTLSINNNLKITADSINTLGSDLNIEPLKQGNVVFMGGLVAIDTQGNLQVNGNATFAHNLSVGGELAAGIIAPVPDSDLVINLKDKSNKTHSSLLITNATGSGVLQINQSGDLSSSGAATFTNIASNGFSIIRGAEADTSMTQTVANESAGSGVITAYETQRTIVTQYVTDHSLIYITPTSETGNVTPYLARQTVENQTNGTKGSFTVAIPTSITKNIGFNWWIVN